MDLMQLAQHGDLDGFELKCMEGVESGGLPLDEFVRSFAVFERSGLSQRVAAIGKLVLESVKAPVDARASLQIARVSLMADPQNEELRARVVALYPKAYADVPGIDALLDASGLTSGRPARNALRVIDLGLTLKPGDALMSRTDGSIAEVVDVDPPTASCRLKRDGRTKAMPLLELAREFEPVDPDDFAAMRQLHPERVRALLNDDPVRIIIGVIRAHHHDIIDQDALKHELVPQFLEPGQWSKWWTRVRGLLKRCPNVILEGRAPVTLRYTAAARTLEDETWDAFTSRRDVLHWLATAEEYLREKRRHKEAPAAELLERMRAHLADYAASAAARWPVEAFATTLVLARLGQATDTTAEATSDATGQAIAALRAAANPAELIAALPDSALLWETAIDLLPRAREHDAAARTVELMPSAAAALLDPIVAIGAAAGLLAVVQSHVDLALADPVDHPEIIYWLWSGPTAVDGLRLPEGAELFETMLGALDALGRTLNVSAEKTKRFRHKMRAALALKDFGKARACMQAIDPHRAITLRTQLERLDGMGDVARDRLLNMLRDVHPQLWYSAPPRIEAWEDRNVIWTTEAGLQRRVSERDHLVNVTMHENAKRIGEAAALGDLSENAEYKFALEERDLLRARLAQMNKELSLAQRIEPMDVPTDYVGVGSRVTLRDPATGEQASMTFFGPFDADLERSIYNYLAPVSQKIMGQRVGDRVTMAVQAGEREYEIVRIENGLSATP